MRKFNAALLASQLLITPLLIHAEEVETESPQTETAIEETQEVFTPFTGKVARSKVRMRLQPNLEGAIVRELQKDQMVIVLGEEEDFYAIRPPSDIKTYIYRPFVLDNIVEGKHVNVRLEPDTESPVLAQLNSGDRVAGQISAINSKWLEIAPPADVRFYVCKDYIEQIGDPSMMALMERRRNEVNQLLETAYAISRSELQKPYPEIELAELNNNLDKIVADYSDFHEQTGRAKALQQSIKETYLDKKIRYLEQKPKTDTAYHTLPELSETAEAEPTPTPAFAEPWIPVESLLYEEWVETHGPAGMENFYGVQKDEAVVIRGIIEPYTRAVRNKPGDYILINSINRLPVAYLYSTQIDLSRYQDQEITISAVPRPNNNFAFPAFYVLSVD